MPHKVTGSQSIRFPHIPLAAALSMGLLVLTLALCPNPSEAARGRWSPPRTWSEKAVHMALLPGSSDYVLASAAQGSVGNLGSDWVAAGGGVTVATGDSLTLTYRADSTTADSAESWFATVAHVGAAAPGARLQHPGEIALPVRFALRQNQPNPFTSLTTIRFDLPVGAMVRLELFDAQGRRVSTLANRYFPAGYQSLRWDPSQSDGGHLGPGVYFYRIQAGAFRDRKKMVLLGN